MEKKGHIAIISAKGGSKGLPGKNIKVIDGKPLLGHTISAALNSGVVEKVFVSTDDKEVANIAKNYGAEIIWETEDKMYPYDLATESYWRFAVDEIEKQGTEIKLIVFMQCTSPFTTPEIVKQSVEKIYNEEYDSVITAFKTFRYYGELINEEYVPFRKVRKRRQEMIPWYCDNGAIYVIKGDVFKKVQNRYGGKIGIVEMTEEDSMEIDDPENWWLAEQLIKRKKEGFKI